LRSGSLRFQKAEAFPKIYLLEAHRYLSSFS
jgi:hypothetical protein